MANQVDLYNSTYGNFREQVLAEIRRETYGDDIGQNSWITTDEYDTFYGWLNLSIGDQVLEVAKGSGGPALYLAKKIWVPYHRAGYQRRGNKNCQPACP